MSMLLLVGIASAIVVVVATLTVLLWIALRGLSDQVVRTRSETHSVTTALRQEVAAAVTAHGASQRQDLEAVRRIVDERLSKIQETTAHELQEMRVTVDEKLQGTLTQRLGESFALVTERLELVHKGLGEMQALANGVGDLKKVLSNVKARGGWGEVQLQSLLEQMLSPEQYERNVVTNELSRQSVEFAVKFPGKGDVPLLLPLDAKFPIEDYQRLVDAHERGDAEGIEAAGRALDVAIRGAARMIQEKYVNPPKTTDFAIMFLPTEGLYAEVLRRPALAEKIHEDFRVLIAGPTTLTAILSSLQMGFRTLAIEKRSSEVWHLLEGVKAELKKFGDVVEKVNRSLETARNHMDALGTRTRVVIRKLKDVAELPEEDAKRLGNFTPPQADAEDGDDAWVEARP